MQLQYLCLSSVLALSYGIDQLNEETKSESLQHHPQRLSRITSAGHSSSALSLMKSMNDFNAGEAVNVLPLTRGSISSASPSKTKAKTNDRGNIQFNKRTIDGIPDVDSEVLKRTLYGLLKKLKNHPKAALYALATGEVPHDHVAKFGYSNSRRDGARDVTKLGGSPVLQAVHALPLGVQVSQSSRVKRESPGVMYLPINQPQIDPCAPPKGSKLMEALPLVFLSTVLSVADAVGNVINNINSNNNNNNNNNDNNINNDNTNLDANINNANQINIVPIGGRALRLARAIMNSIGNMAIGVYETIMPSFGVIINNNDNTPNISAKYPTDEIDHVNLERKPITNSYENKHINGSKEKMIPGLRSTYEHIAGSRGFSYINNNPTSVPRIPQRVKLPEKNIKLKTLENIGNTTTAIEENSVYLNIGARKIKRNIDLNNLRNTLEKAETRFRNYLKSVQNYF